jgi:hypothetical protein
MIGSEGGGQGTRPCTNKKLHQAPCPNPLQGAGRGV